MNVTECKWFGCVYAMKGACYIHGWLDSGNAQECPHYKVDCIRVKCEYCRRAGEKGVCPLESDDGVMDEVKNFIQNRFGYCFYSVTPYPLIYNLYVLRQFRRLGHSKTLLKYAIDEIRNTGYVGEIMIEVNPTENCVSIEKLTNYYKSMGLKILESEGEQ